MSLMTKIRNEKIKMIIKAKKLIKICQKFLNSLNKKFCSMIIIMIILITGTFTNHENTLQVKALSTPKASYAQSLTINPCKEDTDDFEVFQLVKTQFEWSKISPKTLQLIYDVSKEEDFDLLLLTSIVYAESNFNENCISKAGAVGLIQLMPETAKEMGLRVDGKIDERLDSKKNLVAGVRYIKKYNEIITKKFGYQDWKLTLAGYNCGPNRVIKEGRIPDIKETQDYVEKIYSTWELLSDFSKLK